MEVLPFFAQMVARFQQFEVWQMNEGKWEFVSAFPEFDVAYSVAKNRKNRVRLLKVTYEDGVSMEQEVIAEVGSTRPEP
jgi:hypothetical protein